MNSRCSPFPAWLLLAACLPATALAAEARGTPPRPAAPLGLPRLESNPRPGQPAPLAPERYTVDGLAAGGVPGVGRTRREDCDLLVLEPGSQWSRPLRGAGREIAFVSFQFCASASTILDVAGVRLGLTLGPAGNSLQLMYDDSASGALQWKPLQVHVATAAYGGRTMAALPTLTLRLDPLNQTWDLFSGARLVASQLPMIAARNDRWQFTVRGGAAGAWLSGLVCADENPLFADANANGVEDAFERQRRGHLLSPTAGAADLRALAAEWREAQRLQPPAALYVKRPAADRVIAKPPAT